MTKDEYAAYEAVVADFFKREGLNRLTADTDAYRHDQGLGPDDDPVIEPHFSWRWCDCCEGLAGDRIDCHGYNPTTREVQDGYSVCEDCIYYAEYGKLDDMTMLELEA